MEPTRAERILWLLAALGFATAILGAVGELVGWWNDLGQILMAGGTLVGTVTSAASLATSAGREEVEVVQEGVETTHRKLGSMDGKLDSMDGKLDSMDGKLDQLNRLETMDAKLDVIEGALVEEKQDTRVSKLDAVQFELDKQTGVLGRQLEVLEQLRDAV